MQRFTAFRESIESPKTVYRIKRGLACNAVDVDPSTSILLQPELNRKQKQLNRKRLECFLLEVEGVPPLHVELAGRHSKAFWRAETSPGSQDDQLSSAKNC